MLISNNYFQFEEDFVEDGVRCIPMIVRFKLDACGIKLKLKEWSKMTVRERELLADMPCESSADMESYRSFLHEIIVGKTGEMPTHIPVLTNPAWSLMDELPFPLAEKLKEFGWNIPLHLWRKLSDLQRFALLKLSYMGHENRNFPKAMREFGLI